MPLDAKSLNWVYTTRDFYYYAQLKNYSCGAAAVRMALKNITGYNYPEATVRTGCGTTESTSSSISNMVNYINTMQSYNTYHARYDQTKTVMNNELALGIVSCDSPPIIGIRESTANSWPYNLLGHAIVIFAVTSTKTHYYIADPWAGYVGDTAYQYQIVTVDKLYNAYSLISAGYMW